MVKIKLKNFDSPILTENYLELMEDRLSSSGIFPKDLPHCRFSKRSRKTCKIETLNIKKLNIESSSCQCSMTSNGQRKEKKKIAFKFRKSQDVREEILAGTLDIPRPWRRQEVVWKLQLQNLKENAIPSAPRWCNDPKKLVTQFFTSASALSRGNLRRVKGKDSIHINVDAWTTELLFRIIHSSKSAQLSIYGAVSSWCEEFCPRPNEREPTSARFVAKENEQLLKNVKTQEGNSFGANSKE